MRNGRIEALTECEIKASIQPLSQALKVTTPASH